MSKRGSPSAPARIAVAVSGSGRSLINFLQTHTADRSFKVAGVIASRPDCRAVEIASTRELALFVGDFSPKAPSTAASVQAWLQSQAIDWIVLAGFLKPFPVLPEYAGRIVNIHPALLPEFGGKGMYGDRVHAAVLAAGAAFSGATVHYVNEHYDEGAILAQVTVPVLPDDDTHTLADRVFAAECKLYPEVLQRLVTGELPRNDGDFERFKHDEF